MEKDFLGINLITLLETFLASPAGQALKEELVKLVLAEIQKLLQPTK